MSTVMGYLTVILLVSGIIAIIWGVASKTQRKKKILVGIGCVVTCFIALSLTGYLSMAEDTAAGNFDSREQMLLAKRAGFDSKAEFEAFVAEHPNWEAEAKAEQERQAAKAKAEADHKAATDAAAELSACRADLKCWLKRHSEDYYLACSKAIEQRAQYDIKWATSDTNERYSKALILEQERGTIQVFGDAVKLQNGFGAWQNHAYMCTFDPVSKTVLDVTVAPGRL